MKLVGATHDTPLYLSRAAVGPMSHNEEFGNKDTRHKKGLAEHTTNQKSRGSYRGFRHNEDNVPDRSVKANKAYRHDQFENYEHSKGSKITAREIWRHDNRPQPTDIFDGEKKIPGSREESEITEPAKYVGRRKKQVIKNETFDNFVKRMRREEIEDEDTRFYNHYKPADDTYGYANIHDVLTSNPSTSHKALYQALGCTPTSTREEITQQYYKKAFIFHPDKIANPSETDLEKWDVIRRANVVLGNKVLKAHYDKHGDRDTRWLKSHACMNPYLV